MGPSSGLSSCVYTCTPGPDTSNPSEHSPVAFSEAFWRAWISFCVKRNPILTLTRTLTLTKSAKVYRLIHRIRPEQTNCRFKSALKCLDLVVSSSPEFNWPLSHQYNWTKPHRLGVKASYASSSWYRNLNWSIKVKVVMKRRERRDGQTQGETDRVRVKEISWNVDSSEPRFASPQRPDLFWLRWSLLPWRLAKQVWHSSAFPPFYLSDENECGPRINMQPYWQKINTFSLCLASVQ